MSHFSSICLMISFIDILLLLTKICWVPFPLRINLICPFNLRLDLPSVRWPPGSRRSRFTSLINLILYNYKDTPFHYYIMKGKGLRKPMKISISSDEEQADPFAQSIQINPNGEVRFLKEEMSISKEGMQDLAPGQQMTA